MTQNDNKTVDGPLLEMMKDLLRDEFTRLSPRCPRCRTRMQKCFASETGTPFWGCHHYPDCRGYRSMRTAPRRRLVEAWMELVATLQGQIAHGASFPQSDVVGLKDKV